MARPKKKKKSYYKPKKKIVKVDQDLLAQVREQVLKEIKEQTERDNALAEQARKEADSVREKFVTEMKKSSEPWVDVLMWVETPTGVKYQLDWNDAFIKHLENNGIKGVDEEQTVQKWVALLLRSSADNMEERLAESLEEKEESAFQ